MQGAVRRTELSAAGAGRPEDADFEEMVLRALDLLPSRAGPALVRKGCVAIIRYGYGAGAAASMWITFPLPFFSSTSEAGIAA